MAHAAVMLHNSKLRQMLDWKTARFTETELALNLRLRRAQCPI